MNKRKKCLLAVLLTSIFISVGSNCAEHPNGEGYQSQKIVINNGAAFAMPAMQLLMITGWLEEMLPEGVIVEWVDISGSTNARDALITRQSDIGCIALPALVLAIENGLPVTIMFGSVIQSGVLYSARPEIRHLDDLRDTDKIAILAMGSTGHLALMITSKELYGNVEEFNGNIVTMQHPDMLTTVETSDILSGIIFGFPNTIRANRIPKLAPIYDFSNVSKEYNLGHFIVANEEFYSNNPVLIEIVNQAYRRAYDFIIGNPDEAAEMLVNVFNDIDVADIAWQLKEEPPFLKISESAYERVANLMYEVGMIPNPPKPFSSLPNYDSIPKVP